MAPQRVIQVRGVAPEDPAQRPRQQREAAQRRQAAMPGVRHLGARDGQRVDLVQRGEELRGPRLVEDVVDAERRHQQVGRLQRRAGERTRGVARGVAAGGHELPADRRAGALGQRLRELAGEGLVLRADAHARRRRIADDQHPQRDASAAGHARARAGRLGQPQRVVAHAPALRQQHGQQRELARLRREAQRRRRRGCAGAALRRQRIVRKGAHGAIRTWRSPACASGRTPGTPPSPRGCAGACRRSRPRRARSPRPAPSARAASAPCSRAPRPAAAR